VPEDHRPFRASYLVSGIEAEEIFAALLDVRRFPEWAAGLKRARALDAAGAETTDLRPGVRLEFTLNAASITGSGGWLVEEEGVGTVRMTLWTDYRINPSWLDKIAHKPFFKRLVEDLIRGSMRRFEARLREERTASR
jgi:hypothetical protein